MYCHLIFSEGAKSIQWGKMVSLKNGVGTTGYVHKKKNEFGCYFTLHIKINSEWNNLNTRAKTVRLLEENIG